MMYRLEKADHGSWAIAKGRVAGENAKNPGEVTWRQIKWFQSAESAIKRLADMIASDNADTELDTEKILTVIEKGQQEAAEIAKQFVKENYSDR